MSDTSRVRLAYVAESAYATQKTGSNLQILRYESESLKQTTSMARSNEIRSDRQTADLRRTRFEAGGSVNGQFSYGTYDDWLMAGLQAVAWGSPVTVTGTTIAAAASGNTYTHSASGFASLVANQWVYVTGFSTAANNGFRKILTATAGEITVSGGILVNESAGPSVTILQGGQIVNGTTLTTYNIEKGYTDLSNELSLLLGMGVNSLNLNIPQEGPVTVGFDFVGAKELSITASAGSGYTAAATTPMFTGLDMTSLLEDGAKMGILSVNFRLANNLRTRLEAGPGGIIGIGSGNIEITGALQAYYTSKTFYDKYLTETATGLAIALIDPAGNKYVIDLPRVKITDGQRVAGGPNGDVLADVQFEAYRHSTEDTTIRIARFAA